MSFQLHIYLMMGKPGLKKCSNSCLQSIPSHYNAVMETKDRDNLRILIDRIISRDGAWLRAHEISALEKGEYWIVNYNQGSSNEFNQLARGLVLDKNGSIVSLPFFRFFNLGEGPAAPVDLSNAELLEKLDGSMVGVSFPNGISNPLWHTRRMLSTFQPDVELKIKTFHGGNLVSLIPLIGEYVNKIKFENVKMTYVFEFVHDATFVWTKYQPHQYGLYLIGARNLETFDELSENQLDEMAAKLSVWRPRRWDLAKADSSMIIDMIKKLAQENPGFEGVVARDRTTGYRVKIKDDDYVKFHHLLDSLSYKNLVQKVLEGETSEILAYFPLAKDRIDKITNKYNEFLNHVVQRVIYWRNQKLNRKNLALLVLGTGPEKEVKWAASMIMKNFEEPDDTVIKLNVETALRNLALGKGTNAGSSKRFLEVIGIDDDTDDPAELGG